MRAFGLFITRGHVFTLATVFFGVGMLFSGCLPSTSEAAFIGDRSEILCQGVYQQCKGLSAGCRLDEGKYIVGQFPGGRKILVETPAGDWKVRILLFLDPTVQPRSPGTDTDIWWYEPGCADVYHYQLSHDTFAGDLFEKAGEDNVFEVEQAMVEEGDHLVEISSDARSRYLLRADVIPVDP